MKLEKLTNTYTATKEALGIIPFGLRAGWEFIYETTREIGGRTVGEFYRSVVRDFRKYVLGLKDPEVNPKPNFIRR